MWIFKSRQALLPAGILLGLVITSPTQFEKDVNCNINFDCKSSHETTIFDESSHIPQALCMSQLQEIRSVYPGLCGLQNVLFFHCVLSNSTSNFPKGSNTMRNSKTLHLHNLFKLVHDHIGKQFAIFPRDKVSDLQTRVSNLGHILAHLSNESPQDFNWLLLRVAMKEIARLSSIPFPNHDPDINRLKPQIENLRREMQILFDTRYQATMGQNAQIPFS